MFKGIQGLLKKVTPKQSTPPKLDLHPVQTAQKLLDNKTRQQWIDSMWRQSGFHPDRFDALFKTLINNFAEFAQCLPETRNTYFANLGGYVDHALTRSKNAIHLMQTYFLKDSDQPQKLSDPQLLWVYTLFSAAMLHDLGRIMVDIDVSLFDEHQKPLQQWNPINGSMLGSAHYFDYEFGPPFDDGFRRRTTVLLAKDLMPQQGFAWIASDKDALSVWLALLEDDYRSAGILGKVFLRADAQAIRDYLATHKLGHKDFNSQDARYEDGAGRDNINAEQLGNELMKWLARMLANGSYALNSEALPLLNTDTLLITKEAFKDFMRDNPSARTWQNVVIGMESLNLHQAGEKHGLSQFINSDTQKKVTGMVLSNVNLILPNNFKAVVNPASGQTHSFTPETYANSSTAQLQFAKLALIGVMASMPQAINAQGKMVNQAPAQNNTATVKPTQPSGRR